LAGAFLAASALLFLCMRPSEEGGTYIYLPTIALRMLALAFALVARLALALGALLPDARAQTTPPAPQYTFTKVADSAEDGFDPFSFGGKFRVLLRPASLERDHEVHLPTYS
jgi:hypothetical protein